MRIKDSSIGMESARTYTSVSAVSNTVSGSILSFPGVLGNAYGDGSKHDVSKTRGDEKDSSSRTDAQNAKGDFDSILGRMKAAAANSSYEEKLERDAMNRIRVECIQFLLFMLFGVKGHPDGDRAVSLGGGGMITQISQTRQYYRSETEETCFKTTGKVITGDGRELDFDLELSMSRSFTQYYEENVTTLSTFTDPLVINLDVPAAQVSDVKIAFDLDCDNSEENIAALSPGSGYLALDRNGDGMINDGSELFGTSSGDGFSDLSKYDLDGNGWIDEADEVFDKLVIAFIREDGTRELVKLKDKNVGAIYTGSASTDFSLNDIATNETRARIRKTGIFLYENGMAGTVQHLDLAQ
ncbi:MAG: hypothetical protein K6E49_01595 [Lachnospiraceae bacterium]|nr:hypothetical protein [Lachnospiraceae bacterium]